MCDDNDLHYFGTALPQLQIDDLPAKRAPYVEEQVAKDEYGRRRFHGAFTGGFSAGHWNTVGSQEGWQPQDFTSSRHERAPQRQTQRPEDFMDAEDLGEFGIAPQRLQAQDDFAVTKARKRKFPTINAGPIPGIPVLEQICAPVQDKVAIRILKSMGWRPGQGVGPRQTYKQKKSAAQLNKREMYLMEQYGFQPNKKEIADQSEEENAEDDDHDEDITFAPEDYDPFIVAGKENRFGLGYSGLNRDSLLGGQHFSLFEPIQILDKTQQRKFTISGQAFGVGALEEEDEDIYAREDMTNYDFSLDERQKNSTVQKKIMQDKHIVDGFTAAKDDVQYMLPYKIDVPIGWRPRNWAERKSRFAPLDANKAKELLPQASVKAQKTGLGRHDMTPSERGAVLHEEKPLEKDTPTQQAEKLLNMIFKSAQNFETAGLEPESMQKVVHEVQHENKALLQKCAEKTKDLQSSAFGFQPFKQNAEKQVRYDKFLESKLQKEEDIRKFLSEIQPINLSEWEREMEMKEFIQARKIYKPLDSVMSNRFVQEGCAQLPAKAVGNVEDEVEKIKIERTKNMWKPCSTLCKRYNIPEPYGKHETLENELEQQLKNKKNQTNIFDFISLNKKCDFQTPVIIPKHIEPAKSAGPAPIMGLEQMKATQQMQEAVKQEPETRTIISKAKFKPQTDLEKRVEATKNLDVPQKQELFKAIFDSDDEEKEEVVEKNNEIDDKQKDEEILNSAKEYNLLGARSPPRGIFSALFQAKKENIENSKITTTATEAVTTTTTTTTNIVEKINFQPKIMRDLEPQFYGPAVPLKLRAEIQVKNVNIIKNTILDDEWVERDVLEKKQSDRDCSSDDNSSSSSSSDNLKNRKHKKMKKTKHSHKKHKKQNKQHKRKKSKRHKSKKS